MRRFRHGTTFGPVSPGERRNADLFFAELMGRGVPAASRLSEDAEAFFAELVGEEAPPPLPELPLAPEAEVDEAEGPPDTPKTSTVTAGANADEIIVTRPDGTRYFVRRKVRATIVTRPGRPRVGFCSDDERVFFRLRWCEGTQGTIDLGANAKAAIKDLLDKVFKDISSGADPDKIKQTLEKASVQAFLEFDITKVGEWKITGDVKLDINRTGITSGSARVSADRGWIKLGVEYKDSPDAGRQVMVTVDIPLEKRKIAGKECPVRELIVWWDVECLREVKTTVTIDPLINYIEKRERLFLYFDYAKDTLRRDPKTPAATLSDEVDAILKSEPKIGTARLNKRMLQQLDYLVGQGYWLISVDGYASPEGRRAGPKATDRGPMAKWEGNDALSRERAEKVLKLIQDRYIRTTGKPVSPDPPVIMRFPKDQQMPTGVGRSERPMLNDRLGRELEGAALDRAMILGDKTLGVKPFVEENPDELGFMTAEDKQFVTDAKNPVRNRAERLFENLRRVEIKLLTREKVGKTTIPTSYLEHVRDCPKDLVDAAEKQWGSRIPFVRRDPPICN